MPNHHGGVYCYHVYIIYRTNYFTGLIQKTDFGIIYYVYSDIIIIELHIPYGKYQERTSDLIYFQTTNLFNPCALFPSAACGRHHDRDTSILSTIIYNNNMYIYTFMLYIIMDIMCYLRTTSVRG